MLRIRKEQIDVLKEHIQTSFIERMVRYLQGCYPDELEEQLGEGAWGEEADEFVKVGLKKAQDYAINSEKDVAGFLEFMVLTEQDFDKNRDYLWAKRILLDTALPPSGKVELIHERLKFRPKKDSRPSATKSGI